MQARYAAPHMQCVAVRGSVLQRVATHFNRQDLEMQARLLNRNYHSMLQYVAVCCSVLHCVATYSHLQDFEVQTRLLGRHFSSFAGS